MLGFKADKDRFQVRYIEIPLESSVVLTDSIRTQNLGGEENRVLVGQYQDPVFGGIHAEGLLQVVPSNNYTTISATAVLDSSFLTMRTDYYQYGGSGASTEEYQLHEITETLKYESVAYYAKTHTAYSAQSLGSATLAVDPTVFKKEFDDTDADPALSLKFPLNVDYAQRLFKAVNKDDASFTDFTKFREIFKGLAVVATNSKKVVGFNMANNQSFITLYYHDGDQKLTFSYYLNTAVNYSNISFDRAGTNFSGLTDYYKEYNPSGNKRAVQSGSGIITKLDLKKFFTYTDTIPNLIFNSAELVIENVDPVGDYYTPTIALALTRSTNRLFSIRTKADTTNFLSFNGRLQALNSVFVASADNISSPFALNYNSETKAYSGFCTLFFQELYNLKKKDLQFQYFSLYPVYPLINKSVNRVSFNADQIKLRLYFTRPLTTK